ncbi:MAG: 50S ribosomal protein L25 [Gemmatimonadetes bacterium]|nr:50S ribosomal protein L25 [Gemmatimonadota bacterium]
MAHKVAISAERRVAKGKGGARQLRLQGKVPAVIYGHGREPENLALSLGELEKALVGVAAESTVIDLSVEGTAVKTLIREIQRHPVRTKIIHVDFYEIHAGEKITLAIPVLLVGTPEGVKNGGGVLDQVLREVQILVDPANIPEHITADVTALIIGRSLHVRDLKFEGGTIITDGDSTLCTVVAPRAEEVTAPVPGAIDVAEPELIRKPKDEEEGEEGEAEAEGGKPKAEAAKPKPEGKKEGAREAKKEPKKA